MLRPQCALFTSAPSARHWQHRTATTMAAVVQSAAAAHPTASIGSYRLPGSGRDSTSSSLPSSPDETPRQSNSTLGITHGKPRKRPVHLVSRGPDFSLYMLARKTAASVRQRRRDQVNARDLPREYLHIWPRLRTFATAFLEVYSMRIAMASVVEVIVCRLEASLYAQDCGQTAGMPLTLGKPTSPELDLAKRRERLRAYLIRFNAVTELHKAQNHLIPLLAHDYRFLVQCRLSNNAASMLQNVTSMKATRFARTLSQLSLDIDMFLTPDISPFSEPAALLSGLPSTWMNRFTEHGHRLRYSSDWAEKMVRVWKEIGWHAVRSDFSHDAFLGGLQAFLLTQPLSDFLDYAALALVYRYQEVRLQTQFRNSLTSRKSQLLSQIMSETLSLMRHLEQLAMMLRDVKAAIFQHATTVNESGALLPYSADIRAKYIKVYKRILVGSMEWQTELLGPYGYKPSQWLLECHKRHHRESGQNATISASLKILKMSTMKPPIEQVIKHHKQTTSLGQSVLRMVNIDNPKTRYRLINVKISKVSPKPIEHMEKHHSATSLGQSVIRTANIDAPKTRHRAFISGGSKARYRLFNVGPHYRLINIGPHVREPAPTATERALAPARLRFKQTPRMGAMQRVMSSLESMPHDQCSSTLQGKATDSGSGVNDSGDNEAKNPKSSNPQSHEPPTAGPSPTRTQTQASTGTKSTDMSDSEHASDSEHENGDSGEGEDCEDLQSDHVALAYQIPEAVLRAAMSASPNNAGSYYDQSLYRGPENEKISVHYCSTMEIGERVAKYFLRERVLGFDIEWVAWTNKSSIKDNVSLIQVACEDRIALFHLARYQGSTAQELLPPTLRTIIESPGICKVGVNIKGDFSRIQKYLGIRAMGVLELSRLHNLVEYSKTDRKQAASKKLFSLAKQVHQHLQLPLSKGPVRESDWSQRLTPEQIKYAATDSYAGLRIFDVLEAKRKLLRPVPPIPALCDFDPPPRPKAAPRPKPAAKAALVTAEEEVTGGAVAESAEDKVSESEGFETAAEEMEIDDDSEDSASDSDSVFESSSLDADPDADYVPPAASDAQNSGDMSAEPQSQRRRVGRVKWTVLSGPDPMYPRLPMSPSLEDSEDAFDPPTKLPRRKRTEHILEGRAVQDEDVEMEDWSPDENLQQEFSSLEIEDEAANEVEPELTLPAEDANETASRPSRRGRVIAKNQDGDWIVEPPASAQTYKAAKKTRNAKTSPAKDEPRKDSESTATTATSPTPTSIPELKPTFTPLTPDTSSKSPEYNLADSWAQNYLYATIPPPSTLSSATASTPSRVRVTLPPLRAYHMWFHQGLALDVVAGHLRDPPLATSTAASYIVQAVAMEKLEYEKGGDRERFREVLRGLPVGVRMTRWKWLVQKVGGA
ncbi:hypothetical protein K491DRAFT_624958 [Lophiostoma macrostomum CBS 122681]|uniref:3'-5' exonuclease domain-containing protein n=1 Tax=Lophiostoma macrostomum CBS 122681 TaxID=1314788 RepID=A0A6A6TH76_9PLEO|nr:hypothetical protein K491DRAFT_624958 [Lophiostoma macrostomum CBS 122681]